MSFSAVLNQQNKNYYRKRQNTEYNSYTQFQKQIEYKKIRIYEIKLKYNKQ